MLHSLFTSVMFEAPVRTPFEPDRCHIQTERPPCTNSHVDCPSHSPSLRQTNVHCEHHCHRLGSAIPNLEPLPPLNCAQNQAHSTRRTSSFGGEFTLQLGCADCPLLPSGAAGHACPWSSHTGPHMLPDTSASCRYFAISSAFCARECGQRQWLSINH